jgi:hypothetical protein
MALKETDVAKEISLMRLFAVVHHIRQCNLAGSVNIDRTKSQGSLFDRVADELCDGFLEDFKAKMDNSDDPECSFFLKSVNWIEIIGTTPIVEEKDNFLEMLELALTAHDYSQSSIDWRLLPTDLED